MTKQFYEKTLPSQGVYCVAGIDETGNITHRYADTLDELFKRTKFLESKNLNVYITPATFSNHKRNAKNALYLRSFFLDLDVGKANNSYASKADALTALNKFLVDAEFPEPIVLDSGAGIHAYWPFDKDVSYEEWKLYAEKFKSLLISKGLIIDPTVPADGARLMRAIGPVNWGKNHCHKPNPLPTFLISKDVFQYEFSAFKDYFGVQEPEVKDGGIESILGNVSKGLDEDTQKMLKRNNFGCSFRTIAEKSLADEGCAQIKRILVEGATIDYDSWTAGLSIAIFCDDADEAIPLMSEDHPEYNRDESFKKAKTFGAPRTCNWFQKEVHGKLCDGCSHRNRPGFNTPKQLGQEFKQATEQQTKPAAVNKENTTAVAVRVESDTKKISALPDYLKPFVMGKNGGIYYIPPPKKDKEGNKIQPPPMLICEHNFYPIARMFSPLDGECLTFVNELPNDPNREFLLPLKYLYTEKLKEVLSINSVLPSSPATHNELRNYIAKWSQYMINLQSADNMRMQMGWTEERDAFVIGNREIRADGTVVNSPSSPYVRGLAKLLKPVGSYEVWKVAANALNEPGFEMHAFAMLCGFGSPLISLTSTSGVSVCFAGDSGAAKTGALYAALSIYGEPKELSITDATENGYIGRLLALHSILYGLDEISNKEAKGLSNLIHKISDGKGKIRMQNSVNAERILELSASIIGLFTTNQSIYQKLEGFKSSPDGEVARLVEFTIKAPKPMVLNPALGVQIFDVFRTNYGHAIEPLIKHMFEIGNPEIKKKILYWEKRFIEDFGHISAYRFYQNLVSATFAAGELANEAGITDFNLNRIYFTVIKEMVSIRENVVKVNDTDYKSIFDEFINLNHTGILVIDDGKVAHEPRSALIGRIDVQENKCYISKSAFRMHLATLQIASREFELAMKSLGFLIEEEKKHRLSTGWKSGINTGAIKVYAIDLDKTDIPQEILRKS